MGRAREASWYPFNFHANAMAALCRSCEGGQTCGAPIIVVDRSSKQPGIKRVKNGAMAL